tara:strand:- start:886 stop:1986 length:1101 start_codon:yes stop_codon:yes gene_type:complete
MSLISIGKRIGDMDIRLGIPPSKPQFSVAETNRRFSANNVSSNYNSVFNQFRSGLTASGGLARPTQFLCTIDGPQSKALPDNYVFADPTGSKKSAARLAKSAKLAGAIKKNLQLRMDLFCSNVSLPGKTITDDVNETFYGPKRAIAKNVSFEEVTLEFYTSVNYDERLYFEAWQNSIVDPITHNVGYYDDYATPCMITITPLHKTFTAALANFEPSGDAVKDREAIRKSLGNTSGFSSFQVQMYEVWPKTIASTPLAYDAQNQLVKTSVTFTYRNYATTAWSYLRPGFEVENVRNKKNRLEYRTNTTAIQQNFLDNLPFGIGNEIGRAGRQVYETLRRNLPIGRVTGGRVFPKGLPDPKIIRDILY